MTRHRSPQVGRFVPRVETLEDRRVPACNFMVQGSTLLVTAPAATTPANDTIILSDNGGNGRNNVVGFCAGAPFFPNVAISNVMVLTHAGNDRLVYNLVGDLAVPRTVNAFLGGTGNNSFLAVLRRNILSSRNLSLNVTGGRGNDHLEAIMIGSLANNARLNINFNGGGGNNQLNVLSATFVNVAAGAQLNVNLNGGGLSSHVFSDYEGQLNGTYTVNEQGGRRDSSLYADVEIAFNSTGVIGPSHLQGGPGDDKLTFLVHNRTDVQALNLSLDGAGGFNSCLRTTNVAAFNCEQDQVVP